MPSEHRQVCVCLWSGHWARVTNKKNKHNDTKESERESVCVYVKINENKANKCSTNGQTE